MRRVLILEDDPLMSDWLDVSVRRELSDFQPEIEILETESDFVLKWLPEYDKGSKQRPDVIIIDIMLRWTDPDPKQPPRPPEVIQGGFMRAGLRCLELIRAREIVPVNCLILFTSLAKEELTNFGANLDVVASVQKDDAKQVIGKIRAALQRRSA